MAWWKRISRRLAPPRRKARPTVELLEDRATPATISLASIGLPTTQGNGASSLTASRGDSFSADGRYFVFYSEADNLAAGDTNQAGDIFRADLQTNTIALVSTNLAGEPATNGNDPSGSFDPSISADGRFVAFMSYASNLVPDDANATPDVFVKDMETGTVALASSDASDAPLAGFSFFPALSADGGSVAFVQFTSNDNGLTSDVYVKNLATGALTLASASVDGTQADGPSTHPAISADGRFVAFSSTADNLVAATVTGNSDVFRKDIQTGAITLVIANSSGTGGNAVSDSPTISGDGSKIAFESTSDDLVAGDQNQVRDVFVADLSTGTPVLTRVSTDAADGEANDVSFDARLTPDGTQVLFTSSASNLVADDTNGQADVFVKHLGDGSITRVDTAADGSQAGQGATAGTLSPAGDLVAFASVSANVVPGDDNNQSDVFVKTLADGAVQLVTTGASVNIGATGDSTLAGHHTQISDDGRFVVFTSSAANLVPGGDANGPATDVYWHDRQTSTTVRLSSAEGGTQGNKSSSGPSISGDGSIVAFQSDADNLVASDDNGKTDVFIASPISQQVALLSQTTDGTIGDGNSYDVALSRNFQWVAFVTEATNLFNDLQPDFSDVVLEDLLTGQIRLVSGDLTGHQGAGNATAPSISDDGRYVTFLSDAPDLLPGGVAGQTDVYMKDMLTGELTRVSAGVGGTTTNGASSDPQISGDGSRIVFVSAADNLVDGDTNGVGDVFVADRATGVVTRVSRTATDEGNSVSETPSISQDGRFVAFASYSSNLVEGDTNQLEDVFLADLLSGSISLLSVGPGGIGGPDGASNRPSISGSGRAVAFTSQATNLTADDVNPFADVFVATLNAPPNIVYNIPDSIAEGDSLTLDVSGTTDPDGDPLTFSWDLNGDGVYGDATGPIVALTWADLQANGFDDGPSFRPINVQVSDAFATIVQSIQMPLVNTAPTGTIVPGVVGTIEGESADFTADVTDPSSADTAAGFSYAWSATVNGNAVASGTDSSFSFPLADNGDYVVSLTVTDKDGDSSTSVYTFNATAQSSALPVVDMSAAPATGTAGQEIVFSVVATHTGDVTFAWSVTRDGAPFASGAGDEIAFTPDIDGSYVVTVDATDSVGTGTGTATIAVGVVVTPPVVDLSAAPTHGAPGTEIAFTATATTTSTSGVPLTFAWTVTKDGEPFASGDGPDVAFTPDADASYNLIVSATDDTGAGSTTATIVVGSSNLQINPSLSLVGPSTFAAGSPYTLDFTNVDAGTNPITGYTIDWGDGLVVGFDGSPTAKTHTYDDSAISRLIVVTVTTSAGDFQVGQKSILLVDTPPVDTPPATSLTGPATVSLNVLYSVTVAPVTDPDGVTVSAYVINWGDGTIDNGTGLPPSSLSHTYTVAGDYAISLDLVDASGPVPGVAFASVTVTAASPGGPSFDSGDTTNLGGTGAYSKTVSFADPAGGPWTGTVDYGDGTGIQPLSIDPGAMNFTLGNAYAADGTYTVTVALADATTSATGSFTVVVTGLDVIASPTAPTVLLDTNLTGTTGTPIGTTGAITDTGPGPLTATVDYGDGTGPQPLAVTGGVFTLSHTYASTGTFTITVTATDNGLTGSASISAVISAPVIPPNDDFTDLVAKDGSGVWHIARSTGTSFVTVAFDGLFDPTQTWVDILAADFTGDGRTDLAARDAATGQWFVARDTGTSFVVQLWDSWSPTVTWAHVSAVDLDFDGKADIVGVNPLTGVWQASLSAGDHGNTGVLGTWTTGVVWLDTQWADVDGDHRPDLVARVDASVSTWFNVPVPGIVGSSAQLVSANNPWGSLTPGSTDPGDGGTSGNDTPPAPPPPTTGLRRALTWMYQAPPPVTSSTTTTTQSTTTVTTHATSTSSTSTSSTSTTSTSAPVTAAAVIATGFHRALTWYYPVPAFIPPPPDNPPPDNPPPDNPPAGSSTFSSMLLGDVDGDGRSDIVALNTATNQFTVALSQGTHAGPPTAWPGLSTTATWTTIKLVDLNGDGRKDLLVRSSADGAWWAGYSTGTGFTTQFLGVTDPGQTYADVLTGDYNGDGKTDVAFRRANGQIVVGLSSGAGMTFSVWDTWPTDPMWTNLQAGLFV